MTTWWEGLILGFIQGITEWLPVSSSGHLALAQRLLGIEEPLIFDIMLHFASLFVIIIVFWKDILEIIRGVLRWDQKYVTVVIQLIVATIPIAIIGYFFNDAIEAAFSSLFVVGICFCITGVLVLLSKWPAVKEAELNYRSAFVIGLFQAASLLPGLSRSGSTNSAGLIQSVQRENSARFAFLLAIPAIAGSVVLKLDDIGEISDLGALALAMIMSFVVGVISLRLCLKILHSSRLFYFAPYCFAIGLITIILAFTL